MGNSLVAESFGRKLRGTAFGINFAGGNLGMVLVPVLGTMAVSVFGWRRTMEFFAVLPLAAAFLCLTMIPEVRREGAGDKGEEKLSVRRSLAALKDRNIFLVVLAGALAAGGRGVGVVMIYVPLYLKQGLHLSAVSYAFLFTIMMVGSVAGLPLAGRISDGWGRKPTAMATCTLSLLAVTAFRLAGGNILRLVPAITLLGMVPFSLGSQIQALLSDATSRATRDMAYSLYYTVGNLAGGLWSFGLGLITDRFGFGGVFLTMSLSYLAGLAVLAPLVVEQKNRSPKEG